MHFHYLLVVAIFASLHLDTSSAISIDITPARYTGEKESSVTISCALDKAEAAAKEIVVLRISGKGGKKIVILYPNNTISYVNGNQDKIKAEGKVEKDISKSYLTMTINKPGPDDAGTYKCHIYYMDEAGELVKDKASNFLTVDDPQTKQMNETVNKLTERVQVSRDEVKKLVARDKKIDEKLTKLEEKVEERLKQMEGLVNKATPLVAFTATNAEKFLFPKNGEILVFPDVILLLDKGYNRNTGVFTAPRDGLYAFHLVVESACATCTVSIDLRSGSDVLITLKTGDNNIRDQSSVSTVVKLQTGDTVKAVVTSATPGSYLTFEKRTMFSGYLINSA